MGEMKREFGIEFPADFREIVNTYGSIQINGQLSLEHPAGHLLHTLAETVRGGSGGAAGKGHGGVPARSGRGEPRRVGAGGVGHDGGRDGVFSRPGA
ncbi:hypothetical protein ACFWF9_05850 [Streptomyces roseolus]|uniref:hypothetical protein n=1 Tax=Streptomyces roseolus TaxID=67358 RepID=UPI003658E86E